MMIGIRVATFLLVPVLFNISIADEADDGKRTEKQARAVTREVYDKIKSVQDAIDNLASIGISTTDFDPNNLQFSSESFQDCIEQVEQTLNTNEELAVGRVSCVMRHSDEWQSGVTE
jgi:hypothetical protein